MVEQSGDRLLRNDMCVSSDDSELYFASPWRGWKKAGRQPNEQPAPMLRDKRRPFSPSACVLVTSAVDGSFRRVFPPHPALQRKAFGGKISMCLSPDDKRLYVLPLVEAADSWVDLNKPASILDQGRPYTVQDIPAVHEFDAQTGKHLRALPIFSSLAESAAAFHRCHGRIRISRDGGTLYVLRQKCYMGWEVELRTLPLSVPVEEAAAVLRWTTPRNERGPKAQNDAGAGFALSADEHFVLVLESVSFELKVVCKVRSLEDGRLVRCIDPATWGTQPYFGLASALAVCSLTGHVYIGGSSRVISVRDGAEDEADDQDE